MNLSAADANGSLPVSGVKAVDYSVSRRPDHAPTRAVSGSSATVKITAEGASTITYYAVDNAGNAGTPQTVTVDIDRTAPALHPSVSPNPVVLNGQATATPGATDAASGVASQSCATPIDGQGRIVLPSLHGHRCRRQHGYRPMQPTA